MAKMEIFDPSVCCPPSVCGTDLDPTSPLLTADIGAGLTPCTGVFRCRTAPTHDSNRGGLT